MHINTSSGMIQLLKEWSMEWVNVELVRNLFYDSIDRQSNWKGREA